MYLIAQVVDSGAAPLVLMASERRFNTPKSLAFGYCMQKFFLVEVLKYFLSHRDILILEMYHVPRVMMVVLVQWQIWRCPLGHFNDGPRCMTL